jgi:poly(A) polymerase
MPDSPELQSQTAIQDSNRPDSLNLLDLQIKRHQRIESSQSVLARVVKDASSLAWRGDDQSLASLEKLKTEVERSIKTGDANRLRALDKKVFEAIKSDQESLGLRRDINQYGTGFLKTMFLFSKGPVGAIGTVTTYGFDQMHSKDAAGTQVADFFLGGLKGSGMKLAFEKIGGPGMGHVSKGALLGLSNSALEVGLTRESFLDRSTGRYSLSAGMDRVVQTTTDWKARGQDLAVFAMASGMFGLANHASRGALEQSKRLSTMAMGTSFGLAGGGSHELMRQREAGESLDLWKVTKHSLIQGAVDTVASAPGAAQAHQAFRRQSAALEPRLNLGLASPHTSSQRLYERAFAGGEPSNLSFRREVSTGDLAAELPATGAAPAERLGRAGFKYKGYSREWMEFHVAATDAKLPFRDYGDFLYRGQGLAELPMRVMNVAELAGTKIAFVDYEARNFARLDALRFLQAQSGEIDLSRYGGPSRAKLETYMRESQDLDRHPLARRLSPQEALQIVRELPDARMIKRLIVLDKTYWDQPWRRQNGEPNVVVVGEATPEGDVRLFRPPAGAVARDTIFHEWAHLLKFARPVESRLFDSVGKLEKIRSMSPADATINNAETWAVIIGEGLLNRSFAVSVSTAHANPIRASLGASALKAVLDGLPADQRGVLHDQHLALTKYIDGYVKPQAQQRLVEILEGSHSAAGIQAAELLGALGNESHIAILERAAAEAGRRDFADAAKNAARAISDRLKLAGTDDTTLGAKPNDIAAAELRAERGPALRREVDEPEQGGEAARPLEAEPLGDARVRRKRETAVNIVEQLQKAGHLAVFAGGSVRDELIGKTPKDFDVATSASPEQIEQLFRRTIPVGKSHGVIRVMLDDITTEVSTFRTDGTGTGGRRPDSESLHTEPTVESLRKDAARRDLTMNAMFKDPITGEVYDFFGGQEDLQRGIIRAVGNPEHRIFEDRLRMLRAIRFAADFGYALDPGLEAAIVKHAPKINGAARTAELARVVDMLPNLEKPISGERIHEELYKILQSKNVLIGLDGLMRTGLMKQILPEVAEMNSARGEQDRSGHPEGNAWVHTRLVAEILNKRGLSAEVIMAGLLHDIGKPDTQVRGADGRISNHNHDEVGAGMIKPIARRLKFSADEADRITHLVRMHMRMHSGPEMRESKLNKLLGDKYIQDLIELQHADAVGTGRANRNESSLRDFYLQNLARLTVKVPESQKVGAGRLVDGRMLIELGHAPGPKFTEMLKEAYEAQLEGAFGSAETGRQWAVRRFGEAGGAAP